MKPLIPGNILPRNCRKINNEHAYLEYLNMKKLIDFTVTENKKLNHDTILLVLHSEELPEIQPGQFRECTGGSLTLNFFKETDFRA